MRKIDPADTHYSELHRYLLAGIAPRPIAFAGTVDADGRPNLSPFSFFNCFGSNPPIIAFSPSYRGTDGTPKHTFLNVKATEEFTISAVSYSMVEKMNLASAEYPDGVNEFQKSGFTPLPSVKIRPFGVAESPMVMECRLLKHIDFGALPSGGNMLIGEVVMLHVRESVFEGRYPTPDRLDLVGRMGGPYYCRASGAAVFSLAKPPHPGVGFDALPPSIRESHVLSGNDLARLAGVEAIPGTEEVRRLWDEMITPMDPPVDDLEIELRAGDPERSLHALLRSAPGSDIVQRVWDRHRVARLFVQRGQLDRAWACLLITEEMAAEERTNGEDRR